MSILENHIESIRKLCQKYQVKSLAVFGSVLTSNFSEESDIDFVVDFETDDPFEYSDHYFALKFQLESVLQRSIDLLEERALQNDYFKAELQATKQVIYG